MWPLSLYQTQVYQCPYCKYSNGDLNRMRMHVMAQHSVQPMFRCPLCQDMLNSKVHLQLHLTHLHSVAPDCVNKLIATVGLWASLGSVCVPLKSYGSVLEDLWPTFDLSLARQTLVSLKVVFKSSWFHFWHSFTWWWFPQCLSPSPVSSMAKSCLGHWIIKYDSTMSLWTCISVRKPHLSALIMLERIVGI